MSAAKGVTGSALKQAIEGRDGATLAGFYSENAVLQIIDRYNPPSKPKEIAGRAAIAAFWDDVCGRAMTHTVETNIADGNTIAFTEACAYPDGTKVFCAAVLTLKDGSIAHQKVVQAWDE